MAEQIKTVLEIKHSLQIIRMWQLEVLAGCSRSTIYKRVSEGTMPAPISLGGRSRGWRWADVEIYLKNPSGWRTAA